MHARACMQACISAQAGALHAARTHSQLSQLSVAAACRCAWRACCAAAAGLAAVAAVGLAVGEAAERAQQLEHLLPARASACMRGRRAGSQPACLSAWACTCRHRCAAQRAPLCINVPGHPDNTSKHAGVSQPARLSGAHLYTLPPLSLPSASNVSLMSRTWPWLYPGSASGSSLAICSQRSMRALLWSGPWCAAAGRARGARHAINQRATQHPQPDSDRHGISGLKPAAQCARALRTWPS